MAMKGQNVGLPHVCILLYVIIVQLLECTLRPVLLHGTWIILNSRTVCYI